MKLIAALVATAMLATSPLSAGQGAPSKAAARDGSEGDRAAIERLHEEDSEATLSDSADQLAKLWDKDAVRFPMGRPAEIGAAVIYAGDKRWEMSSGRERTLCYDNRNSGRPTRGRLGIRVGIFFGQNVKGRQSIDWVWQGDEGNEKTVRRHVEVRTSHGPAWTIGINRCVAASLSIAIARILVNDPDRTKTLTSTIRRFPCPDARLRRSDFVFGDNPSDFPSV